jgi:hypothetical protein
MTNVSNDYISVNTDSDSESDPLDTPKAPRGKRSDVTEKDIELFMKSFGNLIFDDVEVI